MGDHQENLQRQVLEFIDQNWGLGIGPLEFVWDRYNLIFKWMGGEAYYIKVTDQKSRAFEEVEASVAYQNHIFGKGARICEPIAAEDGSLAKAISLTDREGTLSISRQVSGQPISLTTTESREYESWGSALALLHQAARSFDVSDLSFEFNTEEGEWNRILLRLSEVDHDIQDALDQITDWRTEFSRQAEGPILTHGDMNAGNALWDGNEVTLIDFDEPIHHWVEADVARPFRETSDIGVAERVELLEAFLKGYGGVCPNHAFQTQDLANFVTLKNLEMYGWVLERNEMKVLPGGFPRDQALAELKQRILLPLL